MAISAQQASAHKNAGPRVPAGLLPLLHPGPGGIPQVSPVRMTEPGRRQVGASLCCTGGGSPCRPVGREEGESDRGG